MLSNLNSIILEGRLVADPVSKTTARGTLVTSFSIASERYFKSDDKIQSEASFFDVDTWSKLAEKCRDTLKKGRGVRVVGRLKQDRWTDPDGRKHSRVKIIAEHVEFKPETGKARLPEMADNTTGEA